MRQITHEQLLGLLRYDPETGVFTWLPRLGRKAWNTRYSGRIAGYEWSPDGKIKYRCIRIFDWPYLAHRLAVFYMTGAWPSVDVDHIDTDGLNNRWTNLREATKAQNGANRGSTSRSKTGLKGVSPYKGRFRATIQARGKWKWLGAYDTAEEAHAAYQAAAQELHGEFARSA